MTDPELVAKKLAFIETCVRELRDLARPEHIDHDVRERRFVEHTLQLAIQASLDVASHIVSDDRLGEPRTNHERPAKAGRYYQRVEGDKVRRPTVKAGLKTRLYKLGL